MAGIGAEYPGLIARHAVLDVGKLRGAEPSGYFAALQNGGAKELMMRVFSLAAMAAAVLMLAAAPAPKSPEQEWRDGIVDANKDWAQIPHAILKIQDAAYLGDGQS